MANKKNKRHHRNGHRHTFVKTKRKLKHTSHLAVTRKALPQQKITDTQSHLVSSVGTQHLVDILTSNNSTTHSEVLTTSNSQTHTQLLNSQPEPSMTLNNHKEADTLSNNQNEARAIVTDKQQTEQDVTIDGSRIINIDKLKTYINDLTVHASKCGGIVTLTGEKRYGLASILNGECTSCGYKITLESSNKVKGPNEYHRWECNLAAVWGQMTTGGGYSPLKETMSILGIPVMNKSCFQRTEKDIGKWWTAQLEQAMLEAGKEEKKLAEERNDYHQGVPAITVIVDGGWSKRSHKHSYNAKSGVGIIIGQATGKLLYIGVRNKYCSACTQGISKDKHQCHKNWDDSSSEMEADIILEGFKKSEQMHGVRYMRFVGDGDSSVHPTLLQYVPVWGRYIKKLECANHACKCYRASLEKLATNNPSYKGKGGLTEKMRRRLTSSARCAIKMRSKEADKTKGLELLKKDLINGPYHCFGYHSNCSPDFCQAARDAQITASNDEPEENEESTAESLSDNECVQSKYTLGIDMQSRLGNLQC